MISEIEMEDARSAPSCSRSTSTARIPLMCMPEPQDFLNFAIPLYNRRLVTQSTTNPVAANSTESLAPVAAVENPTSRPPHCWSCSWPCLFPDCCCRWSRRHHHRPHPPSRFVGASTAKAAPLYSRIFSDARSFGTSVYTSLRSFGGYSLAHSQASSRRDASNPRAAPKKTPSPLDKYERKLRRARWAARSVGTFYRLSTFLALCSLTWASVVLLGAFVSYLRLVDYATVTFLLLLEAIRLASAAFFTILLTHGLARRSQDPENIIHGKDDHYRRALAARIVSSILQAVMILPSFILPIIRFPRIHYTERNLHRSLLIFYILIITNAFVSSITLLCSSVSFIYLRDRYDQSILRFYDELLQRAICFGVIQADDFGFFQFAYRMLGSEYARIVQPEAVVTNHRKLIEYLYRHRLGQDFLQTFLNDDDAFVQQAAVNMAGFWADPSKKVGLDEVKLAKRVLSMMADKVGIGQVGWAATNSFGGIARRDPKILAETRLSSGMPLLDRLAELVDGRSSGSLGYVRALALFYHYSHEKEQVVPLLQQERELTGKLEQLLKKTRVHRARLYSAYLLYLMGHLNEACYDAVFLINPIRDAYWFQGEWDLLHFVRRKCGREERLILPERFLREEDNICPKGNKFL